MALEMRAACEKCGRMRVIDDEAYICSCEMHVLRGLLRANGANLPEFAARIAAATEAEGIASTRVAPQLRENFAENQ